MDLIRDQLYFLSIARKNTNICDKWYTKAKTTYFPATAHKTTGLIENHLRLTVIMQNTYVGIRN